MWVSITGPSGVSKNKILDYIEGQGYCVCRVEIEDSIEKNILNYQEMAEKIHPDDLVFTNGCQWDTLEVYARAELELERITQSQFNEYSYICNQKKYFPDAVVYMKPESKHDSYNRMLLRDRVIDQVFFDKEIDLYKSYIRKINIPVIEVVHFTVIDKVLLQIDYIVDSFKNQEKEDSIWSKRYFKYGL